MNDDEKIFSVSEMFYQEIDTWRMIDFATLSEEEKSDYVHHLRTIIEEAKEILDKPTQSDDE